MMLQKAVRFGATGVVTTGVHTVVAVALIEWMSASQVLANAVAFVSATLFSYVVNTLWSFSEELRGRNLFRYAVSACVGLIVATGVSGISQYLGWHYLLGILAVSCVVPPVNFAMHYFWTYR